MPTPTGDRDGRQRDTPQGEASGGQQLSGVENVANTGANAESGHGVQERQQGAEVSNLCSGRTGVRTERDARGLIREENENLVENRSRTRERDEVVIRDQRMVTTRQRVPIIRS